MFGDLQNTMDIEAVKTLLSTKADLKDLVTLQTQVLKLARTINDLSNLVNHLTDDLQKVKKDERVSIGTDFGV